jgi:N-methylhydantoinase A
MMRVFGRVAGLSSFQVQSYAETDKPRPIVPRHLIREVTERIDCFGKVVVPLDEDEAAAAIERLAHEGVEALAICLLWSFINPSHEQRLKALAQRHAPGIPVTLSSDVVPKIGEYERSVTTVANAYLTPVLAGHIDQLRDEISRRGVRAPLLIMHSTGGLGTERFTRDNAVRTLSSGPAGGVIGAQQLGRLAGHGNIVCTDVGGTTFDVGLVADSRPIITTSTIIDQHVMYLPAIDIVSIGTGGGSIVRVQDGLVKIGPDSAGADPGPACYGRGGTRLTLTDANVILGFIDPDNFLGGQIRLDRNLAEVAVRTHVAEPLGLGVGEAAAAVFTISNARMADLIRKVTVERGLDPREFVLYAYGGLGPLHAPFYGRDLGVQSVVVPLGSASAVFSAYGVAISDIVHVFEISEPMTEPYDRERINAILARLEEMARAQLEEDGVPQGDRELRFFVDMRYKGQLSELSVQLNTSRLKDADMKTLLESFDELYLATYGPGSLLSNGKTEIIAGRVEAIGRRRQFEPDVGARSEDGGEVPLLGHRAVLWPDADGHRRTPVHDGHGFMSGRAVAGPAIVDFATSTLLVPAGTTCVSDRAGNLVLRSTG